MSERIVLWMPSEEQRNILWACSRGPQITFDIGGFVLVCFVFIVYIRS